MTTSNSDSSTNQPTAVTPEADQLDAVVQQAITQLRGVYQILPDFLTAPVEGSKAIVFSRSIPNEFLEASAVASEHDETMQTTTGLDPAKTRRVITRNLRFEPLAAAADALARDIRYNMNRERQEVVQQALQVYSLAKAYTRSARGATLVAHVKTMQSALGRSGRSRKAKPAPTPAPAPQQQQ
jgi:hypothetical protein